MSGLIKEQNKKTSGLLHNSGMSSTRWLAVVCTIAGILFTMALFALTFIGKDIGSLSGIVITLIGAGIAPKAIQNMGKSK